MAADPPVPGSSSPLRADLDLRLVRYFCVLAAEGSFTRAAAALRVAQPSLSRQVRRLEAQLGALLVERTARGSALTEAGEAFLPHAEALLRRAAVAVDAARPRTAARLALGTVGEHGLTSVVVELRRRHPEVDVSLRHLGWDASRRQLLDGTIDALVARAPLAFAAGELTLTAVGEDPRVLVVPAGHPLARRAAVRLEDFADEPVVRVAGTDPAWAAFWRAEPRPDGHPAPAGPEVATFDDRLEAVAEGRGVALLPGGDGRSTLRRDLATLPVEDLAPCEVVVATLGTPGPHVRELCDLARAARVP